MKREDILWKAIIGLAILVFGTGLMGYMLAGASSRYMKDDYCYSVTLSRRDFWDGQSFSYFNAVDFSGNRFSLTLGMGLSEFAGRWTVSVLPATMIALLLLGLYILLRQVNSLSGYTFSRLESFLAAEAIALFSITLAPNWIQVIYWRPGMFPYFAPIVFGCWLAICILNFKPGKWWNIPYLVVIFLLALVVGGFSEVASAVEVTALALAVGIGAFSNDKKRWMVANSPALAGALTALVLLAFSPSTALRLRHLYDSHPTMLTALLASASGVINFYLAIAYRSTLLYVSAFVFFCLLSVLDALRIQRKTASLKSILGQTIIWLALVFALTWAAMLPSFYIESGAPGQRVLVIPAFISILLAAGLGVLSGGILGSRLAQMQGKWWGAAALAFVVTAIGGIWLGALQRHFGIPDYPALRTFVSTNWPFVLTLLGASLFISVGIAWRLRNHMVLLAVLVLYLFQPILVSAHIYAQLPPLRERAVLWDLREAQILALRAQGETAIKTRALDSLAGISELSEKSGNWVNTCAAKYYKIKSIEAVQPVLNPPQP